MSIKDISREKKDTVNLSRRSFMVGSVKSSLLMAFGASLIPSVLSAKEALETKTFSPNVWFEMDTDGKVTVNIARAEMGQHVGTAIARIARSAVSGIGYQDSLLAVGERESITSESVFQAAAQYDRLALSILEDVVQALGTGLTNVLHLYNPDLVVLGGGVTVGLGQLQFLPRIEAIMRDRAMSQRHKEFVLVASSLGDGVGMAGAAAIVWEAVG